MKFSTIQTIGGAITCFALLVGVAFADVIQGRVVGVADGDTITVLDAKNVQHKIRLEGIDAPEKAQAFGNKSKEHLSDLVFNKNVTVETHKTDKYGRNVGKVMVGGVDANLAQVRAGFAWHFKKYETEQSSADRAAYADADRVARTNRAGLWRDSQTPVAPWDFRQSTKELAIAKQSAVATATATPIANYPPPPAYSASGCACGSGSFCTGSRGGQYCLSRSGSKRY